MEPVAGAWGCRSAKAATLASTRDGEADEASAGAAPPSCRRVAKDMHRAGKRAREAVDMGRMGLTDNPEDSQAVELL